MFSNTYFYRISARKDDLAFFEKSDRVTGIRASIRKAPVLVGAKYTHLPISKDVLIQRSRSESSRFWSITLQ